MFIPPPVAIAVKEKKKIGTCRLKPSEYSQWRWRKIGVKPVPSPSDCSRIL